MDSETDCKCIKIVGHLEDVKWQLYPKEYRPSPGALALADWTREPFIWMHYVDSLDGSLPDDDVLKSTDPRYTSIHDVQRYLVAQLHCETVLFTSQYPNLRLRTPLGTHLWRANTALKLNPKLYLKELHTALEVTLKKMEHGEVQMDRLIVPDLIIKIEQLDYFKRKTFFRILLNIISLQKRLQLVSLENLCCRRLEGTRIIQQLVCFSASSLKYLFLWRFVLPNENPLLINYSYITAGEKSRLSKLLEDLDVPEVNLTERCHELVKDFRNKFNKEVEKEEQMEPEEVYKNPYVVDKGLLEENDRKLRELLEQSKRSIKSYSDKESSASEAQKPWRTNSSKEKLLRIEKELKRHQEKCSQNIDPMSTGQMQDLIVECSREGSLAPPVSVERVLQVVHTAKKDLPNFQYAKVVNSTAIEILPVAHIHKSDLNRTPPLVENVDGQYIPRPETRHCFLRSLAQLNSLRVLALEYAHLADGSGAALQTLLPVFMKPNFRLQLICREDQVPGRADAALGVGGHGIPDSAWRNVAFACPDLYVLMAFFRIRDYDNMRRFLSPSVPLRELHLQYGVDLLRRQRQDSDVGCLLRLTGQYFGDRLVAVSIHQWRGAIFPLRRVLELLPRLARLRYTGRVRDEVDLRRALDMVACGVCAKLKEIDIKIQDEETKREYWKKCVKKLTEEFRDIMDMYDIAFCLGVYKV